MVDLLNRALTALLTRKDLDRNTLRPVGEFWFYPQVNLLYDQIQPTRNSRTDPPTKGWGALVVPSQRRKGGYRRYKLYSFL